jgi:hypothetical protein
MPNEYFINRDGKVIAKASPHAVKKHIASGKILPTDQIGEASNGPWKAIADISSLSKLIPSDDESIEDWENDDASSKSVSRASDNYNQGDHSSQSTWTVEQLDVMAFLVEGAPYESVFANIEHSVAQSHSVTNAFKRSGTIRGDGNSGIQFIVQVTKTDEGVEFAIDGETPDGPVNFGAFFDPTEAEGWAFAAGTALFNSAVNNSAEQTVERDVQLLLYNILNGFDATHLIEQEPHEIYGDADARETAVKSSRAPAVEEAVDDGVSKLMNCPDCDAKVSQRAPTCPNCGVPLGSRTAQGVTAGAASLFDSIKNKVQQSENVSHRKTMPTFDTSTLAEKYADEFKKIHQSNGLYKGGFNVMAFLFGPLWALSKGLWLHALVVVVAILLTGGLLAVPAWIFTGVRGTHVFYLKHVHGQQSVW